MVQAERRRPQHKRQSVDEKLNIHYRRRLDDGALRLDNNLEFQDGAPLRESYLKDKQQAQRFVKKAENSGGSRVTGAHSSAKSNIKSLKEQSRMAKEDQDKKIQQAEYEFFMLKQDLHDLFDELKGNHSRMKNSPDKQGFVADKAILDKTAIAEATLDRFEKHFDYMTRVAQ